jgi:hypothetical protein
MDEEKGDIFIRDDEKESLSSLLNYHHTKITDKIYALKFVNRLSSGIIEDYLDLEKVKFSQKADSGLNDDERWEYKFRASRETLAPTGQFKFKHPKVHKIFGEETGMYNNRENIQRASKEMVLVYLVVIFEEFLSNVLVVLFSKRCETLMDSDKHILFKEAVIIRLHRRMKAAGIGIEHVISLMRIVHNDLPAVEQKYQRLKQEVDLLESRKFKENRILHDLQTQIMDSKRILKLLRMSCQEEENKISQLQKERIRLKRLVKWFKHNDEEYLKIKRTVKEEVSRVLLDSKGLLRLAFYTLIESMRKDPEKYRSLIYYANNSNSSSVWYNGQYYSGYYRKAQFNSFDSFFEAFKSAYLEDADKLYEQLLKEQTITIVSNYTSDKSLSLPPKTLANDLRPA